MATPSWPPPSWSTTSSRPRSDLAALRVALVDASADDVRRHAHRIKGASRTVGAHEVATLAARLEAVASTAVDDWLGLRSTAEELELAVARVAATVESSVAHALT